MSKANYANYLTALNVDRGPEFIRKPCVCVCVCVFVKDRSH